MPVCAMAIEAGGAGDGHRLREAVLAGPGGVVQVEQAAAGEVWSLLADPWQIAAGLATAAPAAPVIGTHLFDLLLCAFDGTVFDVANTAENAAVFTVPTGGRFPQARL